MFAGFRDERIVLSTGISIRARIGGDGPPVLLLHGYPQTSACWHAVAPRLIAAGFTVVATDLRGYGASDKPHSSPDHLTYSKRAMAADQVEVMRRLGHNRFSVAGHDRGGRVARRLALDHSNAVERFAVLDIAPTATMYANTDREFATHYYHWFFLIQPAPLPEKLIGADPDFYLRSKLAAWGKSGMAVFSNAAVDEYCRSFRDPASISATCEDYRAAASIDLVHDAGDEDRRIDAPLLALWGTKGLVGKLYNVVETWEETAPNVTGHGIAVGHFLPEEAPQETADALISFFSASSAA
ncbi:alpha/beta hydrolase [Mesorhizobium sp. DCY119]|uniref:alpha/beta fold hydrolase n=1 Tax=Mesorhizobium sp. DCY119 TaxID=2108445 RepID=UPI000E6BCC59|nr:alpha/beta hydrolase [Mesorhizobium sp. DCY119]RJG46277.1 alpha/beta hydrolase [Mesorhizobium sp. DCY119]